MKLLIVISMLVLSFSSYAKNGYVKCDVVSNEDGTVVLSCGDKNLEAIVPGEKVKVKVKLPDDPVEGC